MSSPEEREAAHREGQRSATKLGLALGGVLLSGGIVLTVFGISGLEESGNTPADKGKIVAGVVLDVIGGSLAVTTFRSRHE